MVFLETLTFDWMELLNFYERPFRAKLIPSKIWRDLDEYMNDSKGLSNYFKKWKTCIEFLPEPTSAITFKNYVAVGGEYLPDERQCVIQVYTQQFDTFKFTEKSWHKFKYRVIQTLLHEMIHFMQYDRRNDEWSNYVVPYKKIGHLKKDAERRYLSEFDEIQAYAHCIYLDFKTNRPNVDLSVLMNRAFTRSDSKTFRYYLRTFNYDYRNNHAIHKVMQQVIKWDKKYSAINSK